MAYRQIAVLMLKNLFGVHLGEPKPAPTLERLIVLWNQIEEIFQRLLKERGIDRRGTYMWEEAIETGALTHEDIQSLTELRMIRNKQVHSSSLDRKQVEHAVSLAEALLIKLKKNDN